MHLLSRTTSRRNASAPPRVSSFTTALLRMCLARAANCRVERVSPAHALAGLTLAIIMVFAFPPKESWPRHILLILITPLIFFTWRR